MIDWISDTLSHGYTQLLVLVLALCLETTASEQAMHEASNSQCVITRCLRGQHVMSH